MLSDVIDFSHLGLTYAFWFVFVNNKLYFVSSWTFFSSLGQMAKFVEHWVGPYWFIYLDYVSVSKLLIELHSGCGLPLIPMLLFPFWGLWKNQSEPMCSFIFFCCFHCKIIRCIIESGHMVGSFGAWFGVIIVCTVSFHSNANFWCILISGTTWGYAYGVSIFIVPICSFDNLPFLIKLLNVSWLNFYCLFIYSPAGVPLGMPPW